ncbi:uncharacterized protein LOC127879519 isoform X1 [Dreissena polymorpha]|uniref:uncharacterized protein LOC127879519 isoform X1 n=1 Tax=Dreissena polymorpha TaxID=45954 RepID=UPI0022643221|nr:uncharacterized protein LOC127879519 isoform X1 [Dreissena polymorpha]
MAKCFMPPDGYTGVNSIQNTDFNGIINVLLNCQNFDTKVSFKIGSGRPPQPCFLTQARDMGKAIRHSSTCKVTSADLQKLFIIFIGILTDSQLLAQDPDAQEAVTKLKQLQTDSLNIASVEMVQLLREAQEVLIEAKQVAQDSKLEIRTYIEKVEGHIQLLNSRVNKCDSRLDKLEQKVQHLQTSKDSGEKTNSKDYNQDVLDYDTCQRVLSRAHNELVCDLDVERALEAVRSELLEQDIKDITNMFTPEAKVRVLIRRISKGGLKAYSKFKEFLKNNHERLFQTIEMHEKQLWMEKKDHLYIAGDEDSKWTNTLLNNVSLDSTKTNILSGNKRGSDTTDDQEGDEPEHIADYVHDGRLLELSGKQITHLKKYKFEQKPISQGAFGIIFISRADVIPFQQRVVLKEINVGDAGEERTQFRKSVTNEKLASRVMHFGILPLLAYHDDHKNGKYYFISPYLEKGDLYDTIKSDREKIKKNQTHLLEWKIRMKVMYQVASAIDYMHTGNPYRGTILHMDIKSKNILLDSQFNARLIDFGLARELKEGCSSATMTAVFCGTDGYFPTVKHDQLTREHDYHNFGVVMRELLTGLDPLTLDAHQDVMRHWTNRAVKKITEI